MTRDSTLGMAFRGALIAYGVAFFSWWFARTLPAREDEWPPGNIYMIAIGLALQLVAWAAKRRAARYERDTGVSGLTPAVAGVMQVVIDGVTVLLFAIATFRSIAIIPSSL